MSVYLLVEILRLISVRNGSQLQYQATGRQKVVIEDDKKCHRVGHKSFFFSWRVLVLYILVFYTQEKSLKSIPNYEQNNHFTRSESAHCNFIDSIPHAGKPN